MKKFTIVGVTDWEEDSILISADTSHDGYRAVQSVLEGEWVQKIDKGMQKGVPFTCDAETEEDAIEKYNASLCEFDYLKAAACEFAE